jgi:hypothetical protein
LIDELGTNEWPGQFDVSGNIVEVYVPEAKDPLPGVIRSFDFNDPYNYDEWYGLENVKYSYPNGLYLTTMISDTGASIVSKRKLNLDISGAGKFRIKLKNKTRATKMKVFFADEAGNFEEEYIEIPITPMNDGFEEYTVELGGIIKGGIIGRIKILPAEDAGEGWLQYDYIRFLDN